MWKYFSIIWILFFFIEAKAESQLSKTLAMPIGGQEIVLGENRVFCPASENIQGWEFVNRRSVRALPNALPAMTTTVTVAATTNQCKDSQESVRLLAIAKEAPYVDASSVIIEVDNGRLILSGKHLAQSVMAWRFDNRMGEDVCVKPDIENGVERCAYSIPKDIPADPSRLQFWILPEGVRDTFLISIFDARGNPQNLNSFQLRSFSLVIRPPIVPDTVVDVFSGIAQGAIRHGEAILNVDCLGARCDVEGTNLVVRAAQGSDDTLEARFRLRPHVFVEGKTGRENVYEASVPLQRCSLSIVSASPLRGIGNQSLVVKLAKQCSDAQSLSFSTMNDAARLESTQIVAGETYAVLNVPRVEREELVIVARRKSSLVASAKTRTRTATVSARLEIEDQGTIDFIPTNRSARIKVLTTNATGVFVPLPVQGAYTIEHEAGGADAIKGADEAAGAVALRFAYRDPRLPAGLRETTLATIDEPVIRLLKIANIPVPLTQQASKKPLVELYCGDGHGRIHAITAGSPAYIEYRARDTCRLIFHRERLSPLDGSQSLWLSVRVVSVSGEARGDATLNRRLLLRAARQPLYAFISGVDAPFDRILIQVSHADIETHYGARSEETLSAPELQWSVVAGRDRFRLYGTTALPSGLYRLSDESSSGVLAFNAGVLFRLLPLSRDGRELPFAAEAGLMWMGLAGGNASSSARGEIAIVAGLGLSVPIASVASASQTSVGLHAWFEYEVSRTLSGRPGSPYAFVFGPSISVGDLGFNF